MLVGLAVLIALVAWACSGGDSGDDKGKAAAESSASPSGVAPAPGQITPGGTAGAAAGSSTGATGGTNGQQPGAASGGSAGNGGAAGGGTAAGGSNGGATTGATAGATAGQQGVPATGGAASGGGAPPMLGGIPACTYQQGGNAELTLSGDRPADTKYRVGEQVQLTLNVRNVGTQTCAVDLSAKSATVEVTSGRDHIWSPADCAPANKPEIVQVQPGQSAARNFTFTWTRSDPAHCTGAAPALSPPAAGSLFSASGKVSGMQWATKQYQWTVAQ
ncbi:hypothetical protein [Yinghuangia seranimata]|uniref:hypothetical protein n=1 Tax=Yinghuangia seranimata TaxID=408067 RepID=UPI00248B018E|nr:hypothetical protein [Yinghuangia seranimata]MDI2132624.1 hypothetical protein [Yinghuangia seranimata]